MGFFTLAFFVCFCLFVLVVWFWLFARPGFSVYPRLSQNSTCRPDWPWTPGDPLGCWDWKCALQLPSWPWYFEVTLVSVPSPITVLGSSLGNFSDSFVLRHSTANSGLIVPAPSTSSYFHIMERIPCFLAHPATEPRLEWSWIKSSSQLCVY